MKAQPAVASTSAYPTARQGADRHVTRGSTGSGPVTNNLVTNKLMALCRCRE